MSDDPDIEIRDFQIAAVPASGPYKPTIADVKKWTDRLGLPAQGSWHMYPKVIKSRFRAECHKWLADHSHRCTMDDVT